MMISPNCPDHGRLALDLALGRLDDDAALDAEGVLSTCEVCRRWWKEQFESPAAEIVDDAVAAVFTDLQLPVRRRSQGWWAVAAVAVMTAGVATLWLGRAPVPADPVTVDRVASIASFDFEGPGDVAESASVSVAIPKVRTAESEVIVARAETERPAVIVAGVQKIEIVADSSARAEVEDEPKPLFSGGFESGSLGAWVPST